MHYSAISKTKYSNIKQHPRDTIISFISKEKFNTLIVTGRQFAKWTYIIITPQSSTIQIYTICFEQSTFNIKGAFIEPSYQYVSSYKQVTNLPYLYPHCQSDYTQIFKCFYKLQHIITKPELRKNISYNFRTLLWENIMHTVFSTLHVIFMLTLRCLGRDNRHWSSLHEGAKRAMSSAYANTLTTNFNLFSWLVFDRGPLLLKHVQVSRCLYEMGCYEICLADTTGVGTPGAVEAMLAEVSKHVPTSCLALHCHDTYGQAIANIFAGLQVTFFTCRR